MKSYVFRVELESDENGWRAFYLPWEEIGASTWGDTQEQALKNIQEVLSMIIEEYTEDGEALPGIEEVSISDEAQVAVNL